MRILLADDQPDVVMALRLLLKSEGFQTEAAATPSDILRAAQKEPFDLILMDLNYTRDTTSGAEGLDVLTHLKNFNSPPPVVVMTAWSSIDLAVEAMRRGAADFVTKPWDNARLVATLRKSVQPARTDKRRGDLEIARDVQTKLFPQGKPRLASLEYAGHCVEAGAVGGDYFDFLDLAPGHLGIVLADVCGKGMAAALLMANLQASMRSHCQQAPVDWTQNLAKVNDLFYRSTAPEHYATAFTGDYDDQTRILRYANCGHNPPFIRRANGRFEALEPNSMVLGAFRRFHCEVSEVRLEPGDWLILFSDGVVEAQNEFGDMYEEGRLRAAVDKCRDVAPEELIRRIGEELDRYAHPVGRDDWTVVAARVV